MFTLKSPFRINLIIPLGYTRKGFISKESIISDKRVFRLTMRVEYRLFNSNALFSIYFLCVSIALEKAYLKEV